MRIVVTGGAGFIGKHFLDWLGQNGHDAVVIDDFSRGRPEHVPDGLEVHRADLSRMPASDVASILQAFEADAVVHLASIHFIPECMRDPERTFATNTRSTHVLTEAIQRYPVSRMVLASTLDVYGTQDRIHEEGEQPEPCNIYGLTKTLSEQLLAYAVRVGACEAGVALRLANVYGPNETNPHVIPDALRRIAFADDAPVLTMGYLGGSRDFIYVKDVARAFGLAATTAPPGFHALNVGTGNAVPVRNLVHLLQDILGDERPVHENKAAFRKFDRNSLTPRVHAISQVLGWRADTSLADGLRDTAFALSSQAMEQTG